MIFAAIACNKMNRYFVLSIAKKVEKFVQHLFC